MNGRNTPALLIILVIFTGSAALRAAAEGESWARALSGLVAPAHANLAEADNAAAQNQEQDLFLEALQRREAELQSRAAALDARIIAMGEAENALKDQITELDRTEAALRQTLSLATGAADADVARMVSVYETMRAATAAPLFEAMDPNFAAGFLMRMSPETVGAILSEIPPERAYALSAVMAGRHGAVAQ